MIGRGKTIKHMGNALAYAENKLGAQEIDRQYMHGNSSKELEAEFKLFGDLNTRCEKNMLAFVISPTIEDGKKLSAQDMRNITRDFIKGMKLEDHQYVAYSHHDRKHQHIHLYVNRIDLTGQAYKDSFLSNRASRLAEQIALNRGLTTAKQVQLERQAEKKPMKEKVLEAHRAVLRQAPQNLEEYTHSMGERGIGVLLKHNKQGEQVGVQFHLLGAQFKGARGEKIKASDVDHSLSGNRLASLLTENLKSIQVQQKPGRSQSFGLPH